MTNFRLLSRARQSTEYTCGPSALQAVFRYWGKDVAEDKIAQLAGTTSEVGTFPEDLVRSAKALGFKAEAREGLTLDEVREFTADGRPMIALAQVWLSAKALGGKSVGEEWDSGHYIVVLAVDRDYVYFHDPYAMMSKAFLPRKVFEAHWHHAMGGDVAGQPALRHLGIFVRGRKPAKPDRSRKAATPRLDPGDMGSLNLFVLEFAGALMPYDFLDELRDVWNSGHVRPNAFILLRKDGTGALAGLEGGRVMGDSDIAATNAILAAIAGSHTGRPGSMRTRVERALRAAERGDFGLPMADIEAIGKKLRRNRSAIILLFENTWERRLKDVAAMYGGVVSRQEAMTPGALAAGARRVVVGTGRTPRRPPP